MSYTCSMCQNPPSTQIFLQCGHNYCNQCLREAHVQTQIQNQSQNKIENKLKEIKTNKIDCPACNLTTQLNLEQYNFIQELLIKEKMTQSLTRYLEVRFYIQISQDDSEFIQKEDQNRQLEIIQNLNGNEERDEQGIIEVINQEEMKQKAEILFQISSIQQLIEESNNKNLLLQQQIDQQKNYRDRINLQNITKYQNVNKLITQQGLQSNIELKQIQQLNQNLQQEAESKKQIFMSLVAKIIPFNQQKFNQLSQQLIQKNQLKEDLDKQNQANLQRFEDQKQYLKQKISGLQNQIQQMRIQQQNLTEIIKQKENQKKREGVNNQPQQTIKQQCEECLNYKNEGIDLIKLQCSHLFCLECFQKLIQGSNWDIESQVKDILLLCFKCKVIIKYDEVIQIVESHQQLKQQPNQFFGYSQQYQEEQIQIIEETSFQVESSQQKIDSNSQNNQSQKIQLGWERNQSSDSQLTQEKSQNSQNKQEWQILSVCKKCQGLYNMELFKFKCGHRFCQICLNKNIEQTIQNLPLNLNIQEESKFNLQENEKESQNQVLLNEENKYQEQEMQEDWNIIQSQEPEFILDPQQNQKIWETYQKQGIKGVLLFI